MLSIPLLQLTRRSLIICLILLTTGLSLPPGNQPAGQNAPMLGFHIARGDVEHMQAARAAGAGFVVVVFNWDTIEPDPNNIYWEVPDAALRAAEYYGLQVIARLDRPPQWAFDGANPSPWNLLAYEAFVRRVANRYGDRLAGIIIWNEPNLSLEWDGRPPIPEGYVQMLRPAYRVIKHEAPNLPVLAAGLAMTTENNDTAMSDLEFLQGIYNAGGGEFFDALAAHPYGFGRPPTETPAPDRLNFRRLELQREIMAANGDSHKPIWITEMGWRTSAPNPNDAWQVVTPRQQSDYVRQALEYAAQNYPWLERLALWELNAQGDDYGYYLWHGQNEISPAYQTLVEAFGNSQPAPPATRNPPSATDSLTILAPDVIIRLGDRDTLHPHWVHLHRGGQNFSPNWQGDFFLTAAQARQNYDLLLETMQVDQPTNRLQINGVEIGPLHPRTRPDLTSTWVTQRFSLPPEVLRPGHNVIQLAVGQRNPARQYSLWRWENFQFRHIRLLPQADLPRPIIDGWQPLPAPGGWSETNRLRPGLQNDFWLTGNRAGQIWRGRQVGKDTPATLQNESTNRPDLVFTDVLPTAQGLLAATQRGLFWWAEGRQSWQALSGPPADYSYVVAQNGPRFYAGFEAAGLWTAVHPTGPWQRVGLNELTVLDVAFNDAGQIYAAANNGVYTQAEANAAWQRLPSLPGDAPGELGNPLKRFATRLFVGQQGELVIRNLDQLWLYRPHPNETENWQWFGPEALHSANKNYSVLNCCGPGAIVGTNYAGVWQLLADNEWQRLDDGTFDTADVTGFLQVGNNLYAAGLVALLQSPDGGQSWRKVEGLPPTISDLLIDPAAPRRWLAGTPAGIYRSEDGGQSWQPVSPPWTVWDMAFGPQGRLFVARTGGLAWADTLSSDPIVWQETNGLSEVLFFNVDPHPSDERALLAGTWGNDLGVSYDGGQTIASIHNGLETLSVLATLWHPAPGQLTIGAIEGLYRTDTFGEEWFKLPGPLKQQTVYSLLQTTDGAIWAGAADGLWLSRDYGASWEPATGMPAATVLRLGQIARGNELWLWAGAEEYGLWLSRDNGASWQFGGLAGLSIYNLLVDPAEPGRLIAATSAGIFAADSPF